MRELISDPNDDDPSAPGSSSATMPARTLRANSATLLSSPTSFAPAGKGGCWTCRLRRKKCDEQPENNQCQTCRRLRIQCLGWGAKRPDWMRDKNQVEAYKAKIKQQLSSQGMIRGQPRQPKSSISISPVPYPYPERFTPTLPIVPTQETNSDENSEDFYDSQPISARTSPIYTTIQMPQLTPDLSHGISALDLELFPTPGIPQMSLPSSFSSPQIVGSQNSMPFVPSQYYPPTMSPTATTPTGRHDENREKHVNYFFRMVHQIQFLFSSNSTVDVFRDLVRRDSDGVVTTAICALAALHQSQVRLREGLENVNSENSCYSRAMKFYQDAWWQLGNSKQNNNGRYTEQDATAAIQLVTFWLLSGGGDWQAPLNVAWEWLQGTALNTMPNPRIHWLQMSLCGRFTAQACMWFDIVHAINVNQVPRFVELYRRLFRSDNTIWPGSPHGTHMQNLQMDALTGCPDGIMYALAEIACLSSWKNQQTQNRCLSIRELVHRAKVIEDNLRASWAFASPEAFPQLQLVSDMHQYGMSRSGSLPGTAPPSVHQSPAYHATDLGPQSTPVSPVYNTHRPRLVSKVFYETTLLYLHCVVNGHNPAVPEISESVSSVIQNIQNLERLDPSRGLTFPICFAGCLTDDREQREYLIRLVDPPPGHIGARQQTKQLMQAVWQRRDSIQSPIEWSALLASEFGSKVFVI